MISNVIQNFSDVFATAQAWLFEAIVQPFLFYTGLGEFTEQAFEGTEWFLIGVCEIVLLFLLLRPLEALLPAQHITDSRARWNDFFYTVLHRLGLFTVVIFFMLDPLVDAFTAELHLYGINGFNIDQLWPGVTDKAIVSFFLYLFVLDFFDYWYHRAQHKFNWWWGLHSLHHSQRNMNLWSDNRNHLLDDLLRDMYLAIIALFIGVQPAQYVLLVSASRILQSLQHANVRLHFGRLGERLLVSPRYHRLHHAIGLGHEAKEGDGTLGGHNFAVLFPIWDVLFRTAHFGKTFEPTGVRDQLPAPHGAGRDYGDSFWRQQWLGIKRMLSLDRTAA